MNELPIVIIIFACGLGMGYAISNLLKPKEPDCYCTDCYHAHSLNEPMCKDCKHHPRKNHYVHWNDWRHDTVNDPYREYIGLPPEDE